jgi:hypothetical protein
MAMKRERIVAKTVQLREVAQEGQPDAYGTEAAVYEGRELGALMERLQVATREHLEAAPRGGDGVAGDVGWKIWDGFRGRGPAELMPVCHFRSVLR